MPQVEKSQVRSRDDVRRDFAERGITIRSWAAEHGFDEDDVSKVLNGQWQGRWGKAHNIAVALGIKAGVRTDLPPGDQV